MLKSLATALGVRSMPATSPHLVPQNHRRLLTSMSKKACHLTAILLVVGAVLIAMSGTAAANFNVMFPNGNRSAFTISLNSGLTVAVGFQVAGDPDLYLIHTDTFGNSPVFPVVKNFPMARALWFHFLGFNGAGRPVFQICGRTSSVCSSL